MADRSGGAAKRRRMKDDVDIKELNFGEDFEGAEAMLNAEVYTCDACVNITSLEAEVGHGSTSA